MQNIIEREISEVLDEKQMEFSAYSILHRALPSVFDGFKPSYRRILYTMKDTTKLTKSANVEGDVMRIHPHGSCYPTIVNMVQKDTNLNPLVDGKGSFAQHTSRDLQPASSRYSEIKISEYALDMMKGLSKNIVDMIPTFDGEKKEPLVLPVRHPQVLTLAQQGMAVGMASNIPSFNLIEICDATSEYIRSGQKTILVPDFATKGSIIKDDKAFQDINEVGRGSIKIRGKYVVEGQYILIKEIPYTTTREAIIEKVEELAKSGKFKEVMDIKDTTGLKGMEIEIKVKKGTDIDLFIQKLYQLTPFESSFSANMNVLVNNVPKVLGVWGIIDEWIVWRRECIKRVLEFDTARLEEKLHILRGLEKCLLDIDKVIDIIRYSEEDLINGKLMTAFDIDEIQAEEVGSMKLRDINKDKIIKRIAEIGKLEGQIKKYKQMCESTEALNDCVIEGLNDVKAKFGKPRVTDIIEVSSTKTLVKEVLIEEFNCYVTLTKEGYLKKTKLASDNHRVKDGDVVVQQIPSTNKSSILLFSNKGNMYTIKGHQLELVAPSVLGSYIPTIVSMEEGEEIIYMVCTLDFEGNMVFGYQNNKVAKVTLSSYVSTRAKTINAYNTTSPLVHISLERKEKIMIAKSSIGKVLFFNIKEVGEKGSRASQGNMVLKSKDGSTMISLDYLDSEKIKDDAIEYYLGRPNSIGKYQKVEHKTLF